MKDAISKQISDMTKQLAMLHCYPRGGDTFNNKIDLLIAELQELKRTAKK